MGTSIVYDYAAIRRGMREKGMTHMLTAEAASDEAPAAGDVVTVGTGDAVTTVVPVPSLLTWMRGRGLKFDAMPNGSLTMAFKEWCRDIGAPAFPRKDPHGVMPSLYSFMNWNRRLEGRPSARFPSREAFVAAFEKYDAYLIDALQKAGRTVRTGP